MQLRIISYDICVLHEDCCICESEINLPFHQVVNYILRTLSIVTDKQNMWNLLDDTVKVIAFRSLQEDFEQFFTTQVELSACKNVEGLMAAMIRYNPEEWQLFKDSFIQSLKAVLLHKVKVLYSVPVALTSTKRKHERTKEILSCMNYKTDQWHICVDLNVSLCTD